MFHQLIFLLAVTSVALAAVFRQPLEEKPEEYKNCKGCWISKIAKFLSIGETYPLPGTCGVYICGESDVQVYTCGVIYVQPPCQVIEKANKSLPYPDCCKPKIYCPPLE